MLDDKGKRGAAPKLEWQLVRLDTNWQWYRRDGQWNYEAVTLTRKVADGTIATTADGARQDRSQRDLRPLSAQGPQPRGNGPSASVAFDAGWSRPRADPTALRSSTSPLTTPTTSRRYREAPHCDEARRQGAVAVLSGGLMSMQEPRSPTVAEASVAIGKDWGAGAYVTAMLYRPLDQVPEAHAEPRHWRAVSAARSVGAHAESRARTPEKIKSHTTLTVPIKITGLEAGEEARRYARRRRPRHLNLTRYQAPAPESWSTPTAHGTLRSTTSMAA